MPRAFSPQEVQQQLLKHFCTLIEYWNSENNSNVPPEYSSRQRMEGLVHSILVTLDGGSAVLPAFDIIPLPQPEDKQYYLERGQNWYEEEPIEPNLHEYWHKILAQNSKKAQ